ncbi:unnamed protein product [Cyprideis torosa]|uniref:Uncharacterized protein n=1 Tax=Cyprideis torosa TaxID=163714 RepID=A0A7R8WH75_9CRUS|nr:unnamed protein product [Cyprideis torosa]CAG0899049.1 unnamed protein product [Cyprideis torosa]
MDLRSIQMDVRSPQKTREVRLKVFGGVPALLFSIQALEEGEDDVVNRDSGEPSKSWNCSPSPPSAGFLSVTDTDNAAVDGSTMDMASNQSVSPSLHDNFYKSFQPFLEEGMDICDSNHRVTHLPIQECIGQRSDVDPLNYISQAVSHWTSGPHQSELRTGARLLISGSGRRFSLCRSSRTSGRDHHLG